MQGITLGLQPEEIKTHKTKQWYLLWPCGGRRVPARISGPSRDTSSRMSHKAYKRQGRLPGQGTLPPECVSERWIFDVGRRRRKRPDSSACSQLLNAFFSPPALSGNSSDNKQISSLANDHVKVECKSAAAVNEDGRGFCSALEATAGRYSCQNELLFYSQINGVWLQPSESRLSPKSRSVGWLSDADNGAGPISRPHSSHSFNFMSCVTFSNYCNLALYSCCRAPRHLLLQVSPVWSC